MRRPKTLPVGFSLALREEVRELGITVTALCPAGMPTNKSCVDAIEAQGLAGLITTLDAGQVATQTLDAAWPARLSSSPMGEPRHVYAQLTPAPCAHRGDHP